ncbi:MAG: alpha/beta hydrolase [Candidatus Hodarchaeota archaeon]
MSAITMLGVLFLHSFGSTPIEFKEFGEYLQEQGFKTTIPLLPGHGTHPDDLKRFTFEDWVKSGEKALLSLDCQGTFIIGEITGAPLAIILASTHPEVLGIVTLSGLINLPRWITIIDPLIQIRSNVLSLATNANPFVDYSRSLWQKVKIYERVPHKSLREVYALIKKSKKLLGEVHQPIFVLQSTTAKEITKKNAHAIFEGVSSRKKKLMFLEKGGALMSIDEGRHIAFREVTNFLWSCVDLYQL